MRIWAQRFFCLSLNLFMLMTHQVQLTLNDELEEIVECFKQRYSVGARKTHLTEHCFSN